MAWGKREGERKTCMAVVLGLASRPEGGGRKTCLVRSAIELELRTRPMRCYHGCGAIVFGEYGGVRAVLVRARRVFSNQGICLVIHHF